MPRWRSRSRWRWRWRICLRPGSPEVRLRFAQGLQLFASAWKRRMSVRHRNRASQNAGAGERRRSLRMCIACRSVEAHPLGMARNRSAMLCYATGKARGAGQKPSSRGGVVLVLLLWRSGVRPGPETTRSANEAKARESTVELRSGPPQGVAFTRRPPHSQPRVRAWR